MECTLGESEQVRKVRAGFPEKVMINAWKHKLDKEELEDHYRHRKKYLQSPCNVRKLGKFKGLKASLSG